MTMGAARDKSYDLSEILAEDQARAELYGLLGSLFFAPPSYSLLKTIASAKSVCNDNTDSGYCRAWRALQQAAAAADAETVRDEFDTAFITTGRAPVMVYGSYYLAGFLMEKPLAALRDDLARIGLARGGDRHEPEDHISALCDVMRFLIAGDRETPPAGIEVQRDFFRRHIKPWYAQLCAAVISAGETHFYKYVADLAREFFDVESEAFDIA